MSADFSIVLLFFGVTLISVTAGIIGYFNFLQKKSLIGDAVAHAVLPGIVLAFLFSGVRESWILLIGAIIAGFLALTAISFLLKHTKLKQDSVIALVMITFFSLGLTVLSYVQLKPLGNQAGLTDFLFGKIAALSQNDLIFFSVLCSIILSAVFVGFKIIFGFAFDSSFMLFKGFSGNTWSFFMNVITIIVVSIGIQAVGVVLMSALLILPVTTAKLLTNNRNKLIVWTVCFALFGATLGTFISLYSSQLPTGPLISMILCTTLFITAVLKRFTLLAKNHG
jgi:manganese/zinc/iron transport system permease protein